VKKTTCDELIVAARSSLYKSGLRSASKVVCALNADNTAGKKIKRSLDTNVKLPSPYSPEEALALYIHMKI